MMTKDQEMESLADAFEENEAGVADLMELYERVESVYAQASASISDHQAVYTSDSTNIARSNAHVGRNSA